MALDTYSDLKSEIASFLNRVGDTNVTAEIPTFIRLAEAQIRRRLKYKTTVASLTLDAASVALPDDVKALRSIRLVTSSQSQDVPFTIVTPEALAERRAAISPTGRPRFAAVVDSTLLLVPAPDQEYTAEIIYYDKLTPLSDAAPSNELLEDAPDAYLFGSLMNAAPWLEHDERIPVWEKKFEVAMQELIVVKDDEEYGASIRPARSPVSF